MSIFQCKKEKSQDSITSIYLRCKLKQRSTGKLICHCHIFIETHTKERKERKVREREKKKEKNLTSNQKCPEQVSPHNTRKIASSRITNA